MKTSILCEKCPAKEKSVFSTLKKEDLSILAGNMGLNSFKKGDIIFHEGNRPMGLFCIYSGKVKIFKKGSEGKNQIVRLAKTSDIIGYRSLISGEPYSVSAAALDNTQLCYIPQNVFFQLLQTNVNMSLKILRSICDTLKIAEHKIAYIAQKPLMPRLAESLIMLKNFYGGEETDFSTINVALSRKELANVVGTAPGCVMRLLSKLKKDNIITFKGKKIKILNDERLMEVAEMND